MILAPIVEGFGEVDAVPVLLRRIAGSLAPEVPIEVLSPHRAKRQKIVKAGELERVVELAARRTAPGDAIVVILDADDDCPAELGPALLKRAEAARSDRRFSVVLANRSFETWFIAGVESLRGVRSLSADVHRPADPESIVGTKKWLESHMENVYSETVDQPALAARVDLAAARTAPSFDKLCRDISRLLTSPI